MKVEKYTYAEAVKMLKTVTQTMQEVPNYRVGQGLYNLMNKDMSEYSMKLDGHSGWYNSTDFGECVKYFYDNFVE